MKGPSLRLAAVLALVASACGTQEWPFYDDTASDAFALDAAADGEVPGDGEAPADATLDDGAAGSLESHDAHPPCVTNGHPCMPCADDRDCPPMRPHCDRASGHCVQCLDGNDCPPGFVCDPAHACAPRD
jgi:hypothetical protein